MPHVFISYSRKDFDFAQEIVKALAARDLDTWIDWKSIPKGELWEQKIYLGIEQANAFLFLISPDSVSSNMCNKEIAHAVRNGKRILPLLIRDTDPQAIPAEISKRNWIQCRDGRDDFEQAIEQARTTIRTDYSWVQFHSDLQQQANRWEERHDRSRLLRGNELREAEERLARADVQKEPVPTNLQREFVMASRRDEDEQRRDELARARKLAEEQQQRADLQAQAAHRLRIFLVVALILTGAAVFFGIRAGQQTKLAQAAGTIAYAQLNRTSSPQLSLLLSMEAVQLSRSLSGTPSAAAEDDFLQGLADIRGSVPSAVLRGHNAAINAVAFSPDGHWIVTAGDDRIARLWDFRSLKLTTVPIALLGHTQAITVIAISNDARWLATGSKDNTARLWDLQSPTPARSPVVLTGHNDDVTSLLFTPDHHWLISGSTDIRLWDLTADAPAKDPLILPHTYDFSVQNMAISPDSRWLLVTCQDTPTNNGGIPCTQDLWDLAAPGSKPITMPAEEVTGGIVTYGTELSDGIAFSPDGQWRLTGMYLQSLARPDTARLNLAPHSHNVFTSIFGVDSQWILQPVFSPNSQWLAGTCTVGGTTACLWSMANLSSGPFVLRGNNKYIDAVLMSPDGHWVVTLTNDKLIRLWDLTAADPSAAPLTTSTEQRGQINAVAMSPDGRYILTGGKDGTAHLRSLAPDDLASPWELACRIAGRNLTYVEWQQYLRGASYQKICEQWPLGPAPRMSFGDAVRSLDIGSTASQLCMSGHCNVVVGCPSILLVLLVVAFLWLRNN